jgi:hypothetical protein
MPPAKADAMLAWVQAPSFRGHVDRLRWNSPVLDVSLRSTGRAYSIW